MYNIFQIDYDLRAPGRNYDSLIAAIQAYSYWAHALKSSWAVVTTGTAAQVAANLRQHMDANDGLLVTRLQGDAAWYCLDSQVSDWLKDKLRAA
jgi:hypothetical protein